MGTRHLICVVLNGEFKVAQYGQWDGYPSGQGAGILEFLKTKLDHEQLSAKLGLCRWGTQEEIHETWKECGADDSGWVNMEVSDKHKGKYPHLCRDTGSDILSLVQNSENGLMLDNSFNFASDSLFCEWAYVVDLDRKTFEVYEGFNKEPLSKDERFYAESPDDKGYCPVKFVKQYDLDNLPTKKEFLSDLEPQEE
jgi:hypothetical protein